MSPVRFEQPWILLACLPILAILFYFSGKGTAKRARWWISYTIRSIIVMLLVIILGGANFTVKSGNLCRIYLVDNSGSIFLNQMEALDAIQNDAKKLKPDDLAGLIVFGGNASVEIAPVKASEFKPSIQLNSSINKNQTDIEKALRTATETFPEGYQKEIMLFSDGLETTGYAKEIIPMLVNSSIKVNAMPIGAMNISDLAINEFSLPAVTTINQPVSGKIILSSTVQAEASLHIYETGKSVKQWNNLKLNKANPLTLSFELPPSDTAVQEFEAVLKTDNFNELCTVNNTARAITARKDKPSIFYCAGGQPTAELAQIIKTNGYFRLDEKKTFDNLNLYDGIIIDNLPLNELKKEELDAVKDFVHGGGGVLMMGGKKSYALGGYQGSMLEEISPVWFAPPHNIALAIILDRSGSMEEPITADSNKWSIARQALNEALKLLSGKDELEIIIFNDRYETIRALQKMSDLSDVNNLLKQIQPNGSTVILAPIRQKAFSDLAGTGTARKHIILISDGASTGGETKEDALKLGGELAGAGITISTIATGESVDEDFLKNVTNKETNGRFYRLSDFLTLSDFLKNDLSYYQGLYYEGETNIEIIAEKEWFTGINDLPQVDGYNRTSLKEDAESIIETKGNREPILSGRHYGKGKVFAFASALNKEWAKEWIDWQSLGEFWNIILSKMIPSGANGKTDLSIAHLVSEDNTLKINIRNAQNEHNLQFDIEIGKQGLNISRKQAEQTAPGQYEAAIPNLAEGSYTCNVYQTAARNTELVKTIPFVIPYSSEWKEFGQNHPLLAELAEKTAGTLVKDISNIEMPKKPSGETFSEHSQNTLILTIIFILILVDLIINLPWLTSRA
ncbi:MAG: VWA domain-containing protein [Planctomycetes bacterium]|nr:VWA domain-containing protein [Planctomycetota bacterium]